MNWMGFGFFFGGFWVGIAIAQLNNSLTSECVTKIGREADVLKRNKVNTMTAHKFDFKNKGPFK